LFRLIPFEMVLVDPQCGHLCGLPLGMVFTSYAALAAGFVNVLLEKQKSFSQNSNIRSLKGAGLYMFFGIIEKYSL